MEAWNFASWTPKYQINVKFGLRSLLALQNIQKYTEYISGKASKHVKRFRRSIFRLSQLLSPSQVSFRKKVDYWFEFRGRGISFQRILSNGATHRPQQKNHKIVQCKLQEQIRIMLKVHEK